MKISITKSEDNTFDFTFDETKVTLSFADIKTLLLQATKVLMPSGAPVAKPEARAKRFAVRFQKANDVGVQNFIREADPDELLVLLKIVEPDAALLQRFYSNMSNNLQKMMTEDLAFKFKEGLAPEKVAASLNGLMRKSKELEQKGALTFEEEG
jgi:hypothetical protein